MMFGNHVSAKFLEKWPSYFKPKIIAECQSLPSSPHVDELLTAFDLEAENEYGNYEVFLYPKYNPLSSPTGNSRQTR